MIMIIIIKIIILIVIIIIVIIIIIIIIVIIVLINTLFNVGSTKYTIWLKYIVNKNQSYQLKFYNLL